MLEERSWSCLQVAVGEALADWEAYGVHLAAMPNPPLADSDPLALIIGEPAADVLYLADAPEAYQINIAAEGVLILAPTAHGLFDGLQTLWQLGEQGRGRVPCGTVVDWPALELRGIHLDLKGAMAPAAYWQEVIRRLSRFKVNAVLLEYEDKFPYAAHPELAGPGALARAELDELLAIARDHFVEVIPLLQCLGHVEYVLRHPQYAALRESGDLAQFCPQEPGSLTLWRELADEMMAPIRGRVTSTWVPTRPGAWAIAPVVTPWPRSRASWPSICSTSTPRWITCAPMACGRLSGTT